MTLMATQVIPDKNAVFYLAPNGVLQSKLNYYIEDQSSLHEKKQNKTKNTLTNKITIWQKVSTFKKLFWFYTPKKSKVLRVISKGTS